MAQGENNPSELRRIFDSLEAFVYVADMETYEVLYANRQLRQLVGDPEGKTCWRVLQKNQTGPCRFCTNHLLVNGAGTATGVHQWESRQVFDGRWLSLQDQAIRWDDGRLVRLQVATDISGRVATDKILRFLAESTSADGSIDFIRRALSRTAEFWGVRWAFAGLFTDKTRTTLRTLAFYDRGKFPPDITYLLSDAPCGQTASAKTVFVPENVSALYPNDLLLKALGVESYLAVTLDGDKGPEGLLVLMDSQPMQVPDSAQALLRSVASRVHGEIKRLRGSNELSRRDNILQALHKVSSRFIGTHSLQSTMPEVLRILGRATESNRVYLASNRHLEADALLVQQYQWLADGVPAGLAQQAPLTTRYHPELARWAEVLGNRGAVYGSVREFPASERLLFLPRGVNSMLVVPIFVAEQWWGLIGFESMDAGRHWSHTEIDALQSAADMVGAAIAQNRAQSELNFATNVYQNCLEGIVISDAEGRITRINPAFTRITGYEEGEIIGHNISTLRSDRHDEAFYREIADSLNSNGLWQGEVWSRRKNGEVYPQQTNITLSRDAVSQQVHRISLFNDISERKQYQDHIQHLALYDPLTDLPNRRLFEERLDQALRETRRKQNLTALLYIDLDNFKPVNDTFGHATGDHLLLEVTRRLRRVVREADTLARLGGDEFTVILHGLPNDEQSLSRVGDISDQIIEALIEPYNIDKHAINLSASIGVALFPKDASDRKELTLKADRAMYHAKESGRSTFKFYSEEIELRARRRLVLENRLKSALLRNELLVHYQPQVELESDRLIGLEALVRWQYGENRLLYPGEFIPLAENTGHIIPIGYWVIRTACSQLRRWHDQGMVHLRMTVNLSPRQLIHSHFTEQVRDILGETGVAPEALQFDTTEKILLSPDSRILETLEKLKKMGIRIALDDFGSGYSSLAQLKESPFDTIKMDASFIRNIPSNPEKSPLAAAIISLARGLKLRVIAEGVENPAQLEFLRQHHCDDVQGLMLGESLPAEKLHLLFRSEWQPQPSRLRF